MSEIQNLQNELFYVFLPLFLLIGIIWAWGGRIRRRDGDFGNYIFVVSLLILIILPGIPLLRFVMQGGIWQPGPLFISHVVLVMIFALCSILTKRMPYIIWVAGCFFLMGMSTDSMLFARVLALL